MKNILDGIDSILDLTEEKINKFEHIAVVTIQSQTKKKWEFYPITLSRFYCLEASHKFYPTHGEGIKQGMAMGITLNAPTTPVKGKNPEVALLIGDKIDFRVKNITRDKDDQFITIKGSIHQEGITILYIYPPNKRVTNYTKQKLVELGREWTNPQL